MLSGSGWSNRERMLDQQLRAIGLPGNPRNYFLSTIGIRKTNGEEVKVEQLKFFEEQDRFQVIYPKNLK
jgi:hypothetical protein